MDDESSTSRTYPRLFDLEEPEQGDQMSANVHESHTPLSAASDDSDHYELLPSQVVVAVATFKRAQLLRNLLNALIPQSRGLGATVLVIDNDPERSASWVAEQFPYETYGVRLVHEPRPGISAARNTALDESSEFRAICFIDDDEVPDSHWLERLIAHANRSKAQVVVGPVEPVLPDNCPSWIRFSNAFARPRRPTGSDVRWPATNNVLIHRSALARLTDPRFSEEFSLTGGGDAEFFWRMRRAHVRFSWCDEALVTEAVPPERATFRWLWRRGVRLGNVSARLQLKTRPAWQVLGIGLVRIPAGFVLGPWGLLGAERSLLHFINIPKGVGMIQAVRGSLIVEYARE